MKFEFSAGGIVYRKVPRVIPAILRQAQDGEHRRTKAGIQKGIDSRIKSENDNSASGITTEVLVAQHSQHHGWVFPKGLIGVKELRTKNQELRTIKETKEETALREVKEETGINGKIIKPLTPVTYWYAFGGDPSTGSGREKIKKTVYYFLMEYVSGDIKDHDFEMENVEWLAMDEVENRLTYKSDKEVWKEAKEKIRNSNTVQ